MKHIALLGVGSHSRNEHIPALQHLLTERNDFRVRAVCDLNQERAAEAAAGLNASQVIPTVDALLKTSGIDGIIAVTPTLITCGLTCQILEAGIPVLMEKPLGVSLQEAERVVKTAEQTRTPVMVGMNRRHDPVMSQVSKWLLERKVTYARALIHRQHRREKGFIEDAALHPVDVLCGLLGAGRLEQITPVDPACGEAVLAHLRFGDTPVMLEILPACGVWNEEYLFTGNGFSIEARPQKEASLRDRKIRLTTSAPEGVAGGWTTGETAAFLDALTGAGPWFPTPADVRESMHLTLQIAQQVQKSISLTPDA